MSLGALQTQEVAVGTDPTEQLISAWEAGARVRLVATTTAAAYAPPRITTPRALDSRAFPKSAGVLITTSGSSGQPRLIDLSLDALVASATLGARAIPFGAGDVWQSSLAPAHIGGLMIFVRAMVLGGSVKLAPSPRQWSDLAGVTHVSLVATQLARLLEDPAEPPTSLKAVMLGGGPSSMALRDAALNRGVPLYSTYGLTETSSQVATGALALGDEATLAGPPLPGMSITIDPSTREILVAGPTLGRGEIIDGVGFALTSPFPTRDAGFFDARGRLHIDGRLDAMFISGGRNIHPETIERAIAALDGVRAVCVLGVADEKWGMRPIAFVDSASATSASLRSALRSTLEPYFVPDAFFPMPVEESLAMKPSRARLTARVASGEQFAHL